MRMARGADGRRRAGIAVCAYYPPLGSAAMPFRLPVTFSGAPAENESGK